jgi:serine/threonine protein kinase
LDHYDFGSPKKLLGEGSYGKVYLATVKTTSQPVAVKILTQPLEDVSQQTNFLRELEILAANTHPATLRLLGVGFDRRSRLGNALSKALFRRPIPGWNATKASKAIFGICAAICDLHQNGILHRDLKPENVFLNAQLEPVVSDFGLSRALGPKQSMSIGTPIFMAPELSKSGEVYEHSVDVFSFGVLLYFFFKEPTHLNGRGLQGFGVADFCQAVANGARFDRPHNVPEQHWQLIERLWHAVPSERPTFKELVLDFHEHHLYVLPEANLAEVIEYENRILSMKPVRVDDDQEIKEQLRRLGNDGEDGQRIGKAISGGRGDPTTRLNEGGKVKGPSPKRDFSWD